MSIINNSKWSLLQKLARWVRRGSIFVKYPIVTGWSIPRLLDSMNTLAFLSQVRRLLSLLRNLMLLRLLELNMWHLMHTWVWFLVSICIVDTLKNFLNLFSPVSREANASSNCQLLLGVWRTKDSLSLSIIWRSWFMAPIAWNFIGAVGVGKKAHSIRSKLRVSKFFVVGGGAGGVKDAVLGCWLVQGGSAATGCAMVERGGSVIDPRRLS